MTFHKSHGIKFLYLIHEISLLKKGERYGFVDGGGASGGRDEEWGASAEIGEEARAGAKSRFCEST